MKADTRCGRRGLVKSVMVLAPLSGAVSLAWFQIANTALASLDSGRLEVSRALSRLEESHAKLAELATVIRRERADLARVRESLNAFPAILSPTQAREAEAAVYAAYVAVDLLPTAPGVASRATRVDRAALNLTSAFAGPEHAAAGLLSAQVAAEAAQAAVEASHAAISAAQAADPRREATTGLAAAVAFAAAQTAIHAVEAVADAAEASGLALSPVSQPPAGRSGTVVAGSTGWEERAGSAAAEACPVIFVSPDVPGDTFRHGSSAALLRWDRYIERTTEKGRPAAAGRQPGS